MESLAVKNHDDKTLSQLDTRFLKLINSFTLLSLSVKLSMSEFSIHVRYSIPRVLLNAML